jgi:hypothetical protein
MENLVVLDCEVYPNYFLVAFKSLDLGKIITIEIKGENNVLDDGSHRKLNTIMQKRITFGFNSRNYDIPVILCALKGKSAKQIHQLSSFIINSNSHGWQTMQKFGLEWDKSKIDHFDIQEPAPGVKVSLKLYGGRMHSKRLQDLPIEPNSILTEHEMEGIKLYCINDLDTTIDLYNSIKNRIDLRVDMSKQYDQDLRSKSDAQIAEALIKHELSKTTNRSLKAPKLPGNTTFRPVIPDFIKFETKQLQDVLEIIKNHDFKLDAKGSVVLPSVLKKAEIKLGISTYQIGIGGLHSTESSQSIIPKEDELLIDKDVASYYPAIIINNNLYPNHLGPNFLSVYKDIMETRLKAKKEKNDVVNQALKIVLNGTYGKLGSNFSVIYSPDLLVTVTLTGQLSLLMLIEKLESKGISVVSVNTDGFVCLLKKHQYQLYSIVCFDWELITGFILEESMYKGLFSRDVNNYFAITEYGIKRKGIFVVDELSKNPGGAICVNAAIEYITNKTPIEKTVKECKDITQFLLVRTVNGGATYRDRYLGRVVRWIYSTKGSTIYYKSKTDLDLKATRNALKEKYNLEKGDPILKIAKKELKESEKYKDDLVFKTTIPKVPKSESSRPIMELNEFPDDIDYDRYIKESFEILTNLGINYEKN